ncbi:MAG: hypothetical protein OXG35_30155 [Acidobacteria bacterium]|nr:hypothetical protein [Acidobacteriota bacterium]
MAPREPKHRIPGVRRARFPHYRSMDPGKARDRAQKNWERFLRNNPSHKPSPVPRQIAEPCIVHNVAGHSERHCRWRCIGPELYRKLTSILDHGEGWHCVTDARPRPVLFGHPYTIDDTDSAGTLADFLASLPDGAGHRIAVYIGPLDDSWYKVALHGVLMQDVDLPPIRGWMRVTTTSFHRVPRLQRIS